MRINLKTPYAEKDEVKALGARWDPAKKCWYVQDPKDLEPFRRWMSEDAAAPAARKDSAGPVRTGPKQLAPHCGCDVLPWEPCAHSRA